MLIRIEKTLKNALGRIEELFLDEETTENAFLRELKEKLTNLIGICRLIDEERAQFESDVAKATETAEAWAKEEVAKIKVEMEKKYAAAIAKINQSQAPEIARLNEELAKEKARHAEEVANIAEKNAREMAELQKGQSNAKGDSFEMVSRQILELLSNEQNPGSGADGLRPMGERGLRLDRLMAATGFPAEVLTPCLTKLVNAGQVRSVIVNNIVRYKIPD